MFYSYDLLCRHKGGRFSTIWLAANKNTKKLNKCLYMKVNIATVCSEIANIVTIRDEVKRGEERQRFSLYLSAMLLHGACLVYRQQVIFFMQQITMTWESLHTTAKQLEKLPKARHERTDEEDSDEDGDGPASTKKKSRKRTSKKKNLSTDSLEVLESNLEQVLAANANALEIEIVQPNAVDTFQLIEPEVPMELEEIPVSIFGTLDNALLNRMIQGKSLFPNTEDDSLIEELNGSVLIQAVNIADEAALNEILSQNIPIMEQENVNIVDGNRQVVDGNRQVVDGNRQVVDGNRQDVDGNRQVVDGNQQAVDGNRQEKSLAPLEQEPTDVVVEEAAVQLAEPVVLTPVDAQQTEIPQHQVLSTVDQIIEDVISNALLDQGCNEDDLSDVPPRKRLRKWKKGIVSDEKTHMECREIIERARDPKTIKRTRRCENWKVDCVDPSGSRKTVPWLQLCNEPCVSFQDLELRNTFGGRFLTSEMYDPNLLDETRKERSSILSESRSKTPQQRSLIIAARNEELLDTPQVPLPETSLLGNVSTGGVEPIPPQNVPELPSVHDEILPEENRPNLVEVTETDIEQTKQILPDVPLEELMTVDIVDNVMAENLDETNVRPANETEQPNVLPDNEREQPNVRHDYEPTSSQLSQDSTSFRQSQDTSTVFSTLQEMWGNFNDCVTFGEICPVGATSKKKAAKVFYILLELHKMKRVRLNQVSPDLIEIYKC